MNKNSLLYKILTHFEEIISGGFILVTTALVIMNVFLRYVMNTGLYWSEEVATGAFVWSVFIGAVAAYKHGKHIGVDLLVILLPGKIQKLVTVLVDLVLIGLNGYITYLAVIFVRFSHIKPTPVLGVSSAYISSSLVVSFALMTMYSVYFLFRDIRKQELDEDNVAAKLLRREEE